MGMWRASLLALILPIAAAAQTQPFEPYEGQPGKDVVWVPTPRALLEKMLDLARVTPRDFVVDLGSGDGRVVIAAAKRGGRALGIEYDADMVALSRRNAEAAGVPGGRYVAADGQVKGDHIRFNAGLNTYSGRVRGNEMSGEASGAYSGFWKATRLR